jgi:hypothetical protein
MIATIRDAGLCAIRDLNVINAIAVGQLQRIALTPDDSIGGFVPLLRRRCSIIVAVGV